MPISQVALSNTFNEFRSTFNDAANTVNSFTAGTGAISANTITLAALTSGRVPLVSTAGLIVDDSNLTYNTSTDVLTLGGATDASSSTTGTLIVTGGVGVAKKLYVGTDLVVTANTTLSGTTDSSSSTTGAVIISGGVGVAKKLYVGTDLVVTTNTTLSGTTDSSSSTTGAVLVTGGVGVAKKLYVGTDLSVAGDATFTGNVTFLGANSEVSTTQININDSLIQLANNNTSNTVDIGLFGQYNAGSANVHSGLFRDASDGIWKFFKDYNVEPGTTIDPTANGFSYANVSIGALSAANNISIGTGQAYQINGANVLSSTVLGSTVLASSLTSVGALASGSITSAFGSIDIGTDTLAAGNTTITGSITSTKVTANGSSSSLAMKTPNITEVDTIAATAATGTINYDITTQSVQYYTSNASANWTLNFRGSSGTSLDSLMITGESISATFMVTQGATAYYNSAVTIDGSSVTPKWQGGTAPTSGNASSLDVYTYVIQKTGSATFVVLASQTKFA